MPAKVPRQIAAGAIILLLIGGATAYKLYKPAEKGIIATGTVEVTRADIMPKTSGYLAGFTLEVGDRVTAGQTVATIVRPDLKAQLLRDEAALAKAVAQLKDLEAGSRVQEIREAAANVESAQSVYDKAKADFARYQKLYQQGAIAAQQLDNAQSSLDVAYNSLVAARQRLSLAREGNRPEAIEAQRLEVERSKAVLAASKAALEDTIVTSPLTGLVLSKNFENGEYISPGAALVTVGDMTDCWVKIYVPSTYLGLIKIGQPAAVKIDAFPDRTFAGEVKEISQNAEFTPRQSITPNERANLVFYVKVKIDNAEGILKPGMPADVILK